MLASIKALFGRRRAPEPEPVFVPKPAPPVERPNMSDMLRTKLEELGGPCKKVDHDVWMAVANSVCEAAHDEPRPPSSFPGVAAQIIAMLKNPNLTINELVGVVQRDAAIAAALVKIANSAQFATAMPVSDLRGAIQMLGMREVAELVLGSAGRSLYNIPTRAELALYPNMWRAAFHDAAANAFTASRVALEVRGADPQHALLAGLLVDVGRPITLRVITRHYTEHDRPDESTAAAALDEIAAEVGATTIAAMALPDELRNACLVDSAEPRPEAQIARLVSAIGALQRRSPRCWVSASEVRTRAELLGLSPDLVRTLFATRAQYYEQAQRTFE